MRTFGAMTADLLALNDWLNALAVRQVASERENDPEPSFRDAVGHIGWSQREQVRQIKQRQYEATLADYRP